MFRRAVNNDEVGVSRAGNRVPQRAGRQHPTVAESPGTVDDHDLTVPCETQVLQSVVGDDDVDALRDQGTGSRYPVTPNQRGAACSSVQQQGLVAHVLPVRSVIHQARRLAGL